MMNDQTTELIQDLLSIFFTKRSEPDRFELDTVTKALELVGDHMPVGTKENYQYWLMKYDTELDDKISLSCAQKETPNV